MLRSGGGDEDEGEIIWRWRARTARGRTRICVEKTGEKDFKVWNPADDIQLYLKTSSSFFHVILQVLCDLLLSPSSHEHEFFLFIHFSSWKTQSLCLAQNATPTERGKTFLMLLEEMWCYLFYPFEVNFDWNDLARLIFFFFFFLSFLWQLDKQLQRFHVQWGNRESSVLLLKINDNLLFSPFSTFPLISAFPCLFSRAQCALWYTADGGGATANEDVDTVILRLIAPVI